eukprot:XP_017950755.1 PREDICTED: uncharacterized protein LOC100145450 isoform X5 [Xenopus tropicalis]
MFHQMPVTFFDVAASFTEQQWSRLETWKKELYQNVMKELHGALTTLGYKIENPEILFKIKNADDTCVRIDVNSKEKENIDSKDLPDIVVRIKEETSLPCTTEEQSVKVNQNVDSPAQSFPVITSATSLCIKEEQPRTEVPACKSVTVSQEDIGGQNPILVKTEEESYSIDHYNSGFVKSDRSAAGPVEIKQEPEPTSDDDNNFSNISDRANSEGTQQGTTSNMAEMTAQKGSNLFPIKPAAATTACNTSHGLQKPTKEQSSQVPNEQRNPNTIKKTTSDIAGLHSFLSEMNERRKIEEIPHKELDLLLSRFILVAKRKDGKEYEPHTLRCILGSVDRYLKENDYPHKITDGFINHFPKTRESVFAKLKFLKKQGKGKNRKGELTEEDIENLYESGTLSLNNPKSLLNLLFFNNGTQFALSAKEQHALQWGDITLHTDPAGKRYLEYTKTQTYSCSDENPKSIRKTKPCIYETPNTPNRDPITAYIKYKENRPDKMMTLESPFYLTPNVFYKPDYPSWYRCTKIAIGKIRLMMTNLKIHELLKESKQLVQPPIKSLIQTRASMFSLHPPHCLNNHSSETEETQQINISNSTTETDKNSTCNKKPRKRKSTNIQPCTSASTSIYQTEDTELQKSNVQDALGKNCTPSNAEVKPHKKRLAIAPN